MPEYLYRCPQCRTQITTEMSMLDNTLVVCEMCGGIMRRKPQRVAVNWNGAPPSKRAEFSPAVREMIDGAERRRETGEELR